MASAVVFAYHDVGVRGLQALLAQGFEVPLVVTHRDDPGENVWFASVAETAAAQGIEVLCPEDPNTADLAQRVARLAPDFLFSFYYRRLLGPTLLAMPRRGAYNLHGSLLPAYRGRAPINWAILEGEQRTGATLHAMVERADAGPIVDQEPVAIGENDRAVEVFARVTEAASVVLARSLPRLLSGTAAHTPQDPARASYRGRRGPEDGHIDWSWPARRVHDLIRAVAPPYPGAFGPWGNGTARVLRSWWGEPPSDLPREAPTGAIVSRGDAHFVRCGDGRWLEVRELELVGQFAP